MFAQGPLIHSCVSVYFDLVTPLPFTRRLFPIFQTLTDYWNDKHVRFARCVANVLVSKMLDRTRLWLMSFKINYDSTFIYHRMKTFRCSPTNIQEMYFKHDHHMLIQKTLSMPACTALLIQKFKVSNTSNRKTADRPSSAAKKKSNQITLPNMDNISI